MDRHDTGRMRNDGEDHLARVIAGQFVELQRNPSDVAESGKSGALRRAYFSHRGLGLLRKAATPIALRALLVAPLAHGADVTFDGRMLGNPRQLVLPTTHI